MKEEKRRWQTGVESSENVSLYKTIKNRFSVQFMICALSRLNFRRIHECSTILGWLNPQPGECILDIGCGDGYYDWLIAKTGVKRRRNRYPGKTTFGGAKPLQE